MTMQKRKKIAPVNRGKSKVRYEHRVPSGPRIISAAYTASAVRPDQYPEGDTIEVAFLGRSNVGKSSLINSLCAHRGLALVSRSPGKTRTINYFTVISKEEADDRTERRYEWFLVDLPGYGYAKTAKDNRNMWSSFIADYILNSDRLMLLCLLIDGRHPDMPIDEAAYRWLREAGVPLQIVMTKTDKLTAAERQRNAALIASRYPTGTNPVPYSSLTNNGRDALIERINAVLTGDGHGTLEEL